MNSNSFCRLCAHIFETKLDDDLFAKNNKCLLQQIKDLTGVALKSISRQNLPRHLCSKCKADLCSSYEFRLRVLRAQQFFKSKDYKYKLENKATTAATQLFDTVFVAVKEEYNEDELDTKPAFSAGRESEDEVILKAQSVAIMEFRHFLEPTKNAANVQANLDTDIKPPAVSDAESDVCDNMEADPCFESFSDSGSDGFDIEKPRKELKPKPKKRKPKQITRKPKPSGEKLYKCHHCELQFKRPNTRTKHERLMHERDWPFQCEECGRKFTTHDTGRRHMLVHTKIRNFHCNVCKVSFLQKQHLTTHYRSETHKNNEQKAELENVSMEPVSVVPTDHMKLTLTEGVDILPTYKTDETPNEEAYKLLSSIK